VNSTDAMIHMENVRFSYPGQPPLFESLDFSVEPGGIVGLLGRNGAGKTTLLKIGTGVLFPQDGTARLFGHPAAERYPAGLERVAYVPEQIEVPAMRVDRYFSFQSGYFSRFDHALAASCLERFELDRSALLQNLSFGQQKKVLLAGALASGADLMVLDEPTNGLDIPAKEVFRVLVAEAARAGRSLVISTHQVKDVESVVDPVVILEGGTVVFRASAATIAERLAIRRFDHREDAGAATVLAFSSHRGYTLGLVPRSEMDPAGEIDLELLFHAAVTNPEGLNRICGGGV
jgi:ABC-2 type transport system ATP-binding protein